MTVPVTFPLRVKSWHGLDGSRGCGGRGGVRRNLSVTGNQLPGSVFSGAFPSGAP